MVRLHQQSRSIHLKRGSTARLGGNMRVKSYPPFRFLYPGPRTTRPGLAPVCSPSLST